MRALFMAGLVVLVLGIASFFVAVPIQEKHRLKAGPLSVGVETTDYQKAPPYVSGVIVAAGVVMMIAGAKRR